MGKDEPDMGKGRCHIMMKGHAGLPPEHLI